MKVVAALLLVLAVTALVAADVTSPICNEIVPLEECTRDEGNRYPQHKQPVYLGDVSEGPDWWLYPQSDGPNVIPYPHDTHTITDTEGRWAKWIWHDCGNGYVCIESGRYPNYYLYPKVFFNSVDLKYYHSYDPKSEDWTKFRVTTQRRDDRGLLVSIVGKEQEGYSNPTGSSMYIYIPPRCEGYQEVANHANGSPVPVNHKYTLQRGVTNTEKVSTTTGAEFQVGIDLVNEVVQGVLSASFSTSWTQEKSKALSETQTHEMSVQIPPGKHLIKWQKVATYGHYVWRSAIFVTCMKDI